MRSAPTHFVTAVLALLIAPLALAQDRPTATDSSPEDRAPRDLYFPKGTKDLAVYASYAHPTLGDDERYYSVTTSAGYYFQDNHAINLSLVGHVIDPTTDASTAVAGEILLTGRLHFLTIDRFTVFFEGGCGFMYADHQLPEVGDGTHWNFTPQAGFGATYHLRDNAHLLAGVRFFHASNAGLQGSDRHPGSNAVMGYVGMLWTF